MNKDKAWAERNRKYPFGAIVETLLNGKVVRCEVRTAWLWFLGTSKGIRYACWYPSGKVTRVLHVAENNILKRLDVPK